MSDVLYPILEAKRARLKKSKENFPLEQLKEICRTLPAPPPFVSSIVRPGQLTVIAEMKKSSPSAGLILPIYEPEKIAAAYARCGAAGISVLTEEDYFHGSQTDLKEVRAAVSLPIIRKDFIFDPYQVYETRSMGASAMLLISAILSAEDLFVLHALALSLGLDVLVEVHTPAELDLALTVRPRLIGINNRNLKTLAIDLATTFALRPRVPSDIHVVSESGIKTEQDVCRLKSVNVQSVLVGESILKSPEMTKTLTGLVRAGE